MAKKTKRHKPTYKPADSKIVKWIVIFILVFVGLVCLKKLFKYQYMGWKNMPYASPSPMAEQNIMVFTPAQNEKIVLPYTITGKARTFESNVQLRVEDENGNSLYETYTTADAPEMGEYGPYSMRLTGIEPGLQNMSGEKIVIVVFESSARDGSEINVVRIPVTVR